MSRTQHLASALAALLTLLPPGVNAQATQTPAPAQIVALVKGSPQLRIDETISSSGFDAQTHPFVNIRVAPEGTIGGYLVPEGAHDGTLRDGTYALAVPLDSGGSHLSVSVADGAIVAELPCYGDDSPNCCPKKYVVQTYTVRGGGLVKLSERFEEARDE